MSAAIVPTRTMMMESAPRAATRLRLTRRGRIVFTALASLPLVAWALVTVLGSGGAAADGGSSAPASSFEAPSFEAPSFEYVTIGQGDSLWAIAESLAPDGDPRVLIDEIIRLNGLDDAVVEPGQRLALPVVP
jgi:hypothetical protein